MCGFQTVNFCHSSYIISLGGSRFFLLWTGRKFRIRKESLYFNRNEITKVTGVGVQISTPWDQISLLGVFFWEGRKLFTGRDSPLLNLSPTAVPSRLSALPRVQVGTMQPAMVVGRLTMQADYQSSPSLVSLFS